MTLLELQKLLGETITQIHNSDESTKGFKLITEKAEFEAKIAKQIINASDVILRTDKMCNRNDRINQIIGG